MFGIGALISENKHGLGAVGLTGWARRGFMGGVEGAVRAPSGIAAAVAVAARGQGHREGDRHRQRPPYRTTQTGWAGANIPPAREVV